jgi:hypothetical protein
MSLCRCASEKCNRDFDSLGSILETNYSHLLSPPDKTPPPYSCMLSNSMKQSRSWEANSRSASLEIKCLLWNPKARGHSTHHWTLC